MAEKEAEAVRPAGRGGGAPPDEGGKVGAVVVEDTVLATRPVGNGGGFDEEREVEEGAGGRLG